jgi:hypothetical protein
MIFLIICCKFQQLSSLDWMVLHIVTSTLVLLDFILIFLEKFRNKSKCEMF